MASQHEFELWTETCVLNGSAFDSCFCVGVPVGCELQCFCRSCWCIAFVCVFGPFCVVVLVRRVQMTVVCRGASLNVEQRAFLLSSMAVLLCTSCPCRNTFSGGAYLCSSLPGVCDLGPSVF